MRAYTLGLALLCSTGTAFAATTVYTEASLTNVSLTLTDLRPGDSVEPRWVDKGLRTGSSMAAGSVGYTVDLADVAFGNSSLTGASDTGVIVGSGSTTSSGDYHASTVHSTEGQHGRTLASGGAFTNGYIELSPYTALTLSADAFVSVFGELPRGETYGAAVTWLRLTNDDQWLQALLVAPNNGSATDALEVTFENRTGRRMSVYLSIVAGTSSAVPEPDTCALLLAGLGLVGACAKRRARGRLGSEA